MPPLCGASNGRAGSPRLLFLRVQFKEDDMSIGTILIIVLVLALVGVIPTWGHSSSWGYGPSGVVGLILLVLVIMLLMGKL
jgi:hypothetical protein